MGAMAHDQTIVDPASSAGADLGTGDPHHDHHGG